VSDQKKINSWIRLAANLGLLLTDAEMRRDAGREVKARVDRVAEAISDRYDDAADRLGPATHCGAGPIGRRERSRCSWELPSEPASA